MLRTIDDELNEAVDFINDEDFLEALPLLARVTSFEPDNEIAYELWVHCHVRLGRLERAVALADDGLRRGLLPAVLNAHKSAALRLLNRLDEAIDAAKAGLAADPESSFAIRALAESEIARGAQEVAIGIYQQALARHPEDEVLYYSLLDLASETERFELTIETARQCLRHIGKDPQVLSLLGHAYVGVGDYRRADRAFRDAAGIEPDEIEHHTNVLLLALLMRNEASFDAYAARLESLDPELAEEATREAARLIDQLSAEE